MKFINISIENKKWFFFSPHQRHPYGDGMLILAKLKFFDKFEKNSKCNFPILLIILRHLSRGFIDIFSISIKNRNSNFLCTNMCCLWYEIWKFFKKLNLIAKCTIINFFSFILAQEVYTDDNQWKLSTFRAKLKNDFFFSPHQRHPYGDGVWNLTKSEKSDEFEKNSKCNFPILLIILRHLSRGFIDI